MTRKAAIIGGGVIGGGWAARFLLNGWNVSVFDPDPEAERKISEVMANARAALPALSDVPMPPEGNLSFAGTISKSGDDARDLALAGSLARSSKDLEEHEYAVRSVADALEPFCTSTNVPESPFVLHLANVMHLATDVTGALIESKVDVDAFSLLSRLHPSAAVCGTPTHLASKVISSIEGMNRGRYAGPVGWIDSHGDGELGIALRCGQVTDTTIRIFAGCGIVSGSNPEKELHESNAKFAPMRSALE